MNIDFNRPPCVGDELYYIGKIVGGNKLSGDGKYSQDCQRWFEDNLPTYRALLTPSCTAALEMAAILINVSPGDEIIMPSYTFVSTANAFVLRGATIKFVDIRPDTMNIDESCIVDAITDKTKAIVVVHYAGVSCEMDKIMNIAKEHSLFVIEDAAQGMMSNYKGKALGTIGHLGAYSFHETKNFTSGGEGGLLIINDETFSERAEIIREKGTNRQKFFRGAVDKYSWVDVGSSFLSCELQSAYLWAQLQKVNLMHDSRMKSWSYYNENLQIVASRGFIELPQIPIDCNHNAHMFYIKLKSIDVRTSLINYLKKCGITSVFHYVPLHSSIAGKKFGSFVGNDIYTTYESERILRLPIWYGIPLIEQEYVVQKLIEFFE